MEESNLDIVLYSTGCPRCAVLKSKLGACGISYREETDVDKMISLGLTEVPALEVDGRILSFVDAVRWVNAQ